MQKQSKKFNYGIVVLGLICVGIFTANYAQYQIPPFGTQLMETLGLSSSQFSSIATAPLIPGILLSLVAGMLVDKFGTRKMLVIATAVSTVALVLRALSKSYLPMYLSSIFIGICATFFSANCPKIAGMWFTPEKTSVTTGIYLSFSYAGMALGIGTASLYASMKSAFAGAAILGVIVFVMWALFMREHPDEKLRRADETSGVTFKEGLTAALKSKDVWLAATALFLSLGSLTSFANFMPTALESRGIASGTASSISMSITLGALACSFLAPVIASKLGKVKVMMFVFAILAAVGMIFAWRISKDPVVLFILLFIVGFLGNGFAPVILSLPVRLPEIGTKYGGTAGGLLSTIQLAGSVTIPTYVIAPIAGNDYSLMFILFACMLVAFCIVAHFLPLEEKK